MKAFKYMSKQKRKNITYKRKKKSGWPETTHQHSKTEQNRFMSVQS